MSELPTGVITSLEVGNVSDAFSAPMVTATGRDAFGQHVASSIMTDDDVALRSVRVLGLDDSPSRVGSSSAGIAADECVPNTVAARAYFTASDVVVVRKTSPAKLPKLRIIQQWEGRVDYQLSGTIHATLRDLSGNAEFVEAAEIPLDLVAAADRDLAIPGSLFYLTVGMRTSPGGQVENTSWLKFSRVHRGSPQTGDSEESAQLRRVLGLG